jgi:N utilization substance protein A
MSEKKAVIIVPDDQLAIAIGKDWQNIKLASRLTGWDLEVKSESQKAKEAEEAAAATQDAISDIAGIGPKTAEILQKAGYTSAEQIAAVEPEHLAALQGIGEKTAAKIIESAKNHIKAQEAADDQSNQ